MTALALFSAQLAACGGDAQIGSSRQDKILLPERAPTDPGEGDAEESEEENEVTAALRAELQSTLNEPLTVEEQALVNALEQGLDPSDIDEQLVQEAGLGGACAREAQVDSVVIACNAGELSTWDIAKKLATCLGGHVPWGKALKVAKSVYKIYKAYRAAQISVVLAKKLFKEVVVGEDCEEVANAIFG